MKLCDLNTDVLFRSFLTLSLSLSSLITSSPHITFSPCTASPLYRYVVGDDINMWSWHIFSGKHFLINLSKSQLYFKSEVQKHIPRDVLWRRRAVKIWGLIMVGKGLDVPSYPILSTLPPKIISLHNLLSTFLLSPSLFYFMPNPLLSSNIVTANTDTPTGIDGQNDWRSQSNFLLAKAYRLQFAAPNKNVGAPLRGAAVSTQLNANTAFCTATRRNNYELCVYIYYVSHT